MNLVAIGLTHKTAPVEVRERFAFSDDEAASLLSELRNGLVHEALLISTCNRTELYVVPALQEVTAEYLIEFLIERKGARKDVRPDNFFKQFACGAVKHLFTVSSAADSMMLGEAQILGQVKDAYRLAAERQATGMILNKLAHAAFSTAKRVKSETQFNDGAVSVSYAAVELARKIFTDLSTKKILLIGAGETAELAAKHLAEKKAKSIVITNRTRENAERLAAEIPNASVAEFESLRTSLAEFDMIISAISQSDVLSAKDIDDAMHKRGRATMLILDLGVPRNIDAKAASLYNVFLKDVDDLKLIVSKNIDARKSELPTIETILLEEVTAFENWFASLQVTPTIRSLQEKFESIKRTELEKLKNKVSPEEYKNLELLADRLIGKLMHYPIRSLKTPTDVTTDIASRVNLIRALFDLET
jgi:glutamyl-tRNA reductase